MCLRRWLSITRATTALNHISDLDPHDAYVLTRDFNCPTLFDCRSGTAGDTSADPAPCRLQSAANPTNILKRATPRAVVSRAIEKPGCTTHGAL